MEPIELFGSITQWAALLKQKKVSSVELTQMHLDRLKTVGNGHRVYRELTESLAMTQAKASDQRRQSGKSIGPLDGIPFGVKDLISSKGIPTRWGSPGHADQVFQFDATSLARLQNAGAVLVAKLAMIELAGGGNYDLAGASDVGATLSAWNKKMWAGGSSSGTGAAVGSGCVVFGLGSETSGSIVCPSAFNGVTGFRPSYGRVSRFGAMALAWTLDKVGPLARSAADCRLILQAIAGPDPLDPTTTHEPLNFKLPKRKLRIGVMKESFDGNKATACQMGYDATIAALKKLGHEIVDVAYPTGLPNAGVIVGLIVDGEGASAHENFIRSEKLKMLADINQVAGFTASLEQPTTDYLWAMRARVKLARANEIWQKCDVLLRPVFYHSGLSADKPLSATWTQMGDSSISLANALGWPACAFPMAWESDSREWIGERAPRYGDNPIAGQIIGPAYSDALCLQVVEQIQSVTDWHRQHPTAP